MRAPGYGETQPRLDDDRMPVVLVTLDGLGDRAIPELGHRTPAEAAVTPTLDRLTVRGASGWHVPFGWGRAPASELAHWAMFGFSDIAFPGRAVLEGLGAGLHLATDTAVTFAALRTSTTVKDQVWVTGRAARDDTDEAETLFGELAVLAQSYEARIHSLGRGEAVIEFLRFSAGEVTDSDPFFEDFHPWLRIQPVTAVAAAVAEHMNRFLLDARAHLLRSSVNAARITDNRPALNLLTTKWSGTRTAIPHFAEVTGVPGAAVTSTRLYRGLAAVLGMRHEHLPPHPDLGRDIAVRIKLAHQLIADGAQFVHVHTKATDEAGHTKRPHAKLEVLQALDPGLAGLELLANHAVVAITGDHATPSIHGVLHTADPAPLLVVGPTVRPDAVTAFGETYAHHGWYGTVAARDLLPLLFSHANRPVFLGHRATARQTLALPDAPTPMPTR